MNNWQTSKTLRDISEAYSAVYEAKKSNDGDLANNYPPYDKVTRGDVIAGARGEDQMGGKKKKATKEEYTDYEIVASYLLEYNFAETLEDANKIIENMSDNWIAEILDEERAPGVKAYRPNPTQAAVRADAKKAREKHMKSGEGKSGYGPDEKFKDWKDRSTPASTLKRKGGETETVSQRMDREKPYGKRMTGEIARKYGSRTAAEVTRATEGPGEPQSVTMPRMKSKPSRQIIRRG